MNRNCLYGITTVGRFFLATVLRDGPGNDHAPEGDACGYEHLASEDCRKKMGQQVACNGHSLLNNVDAIRALVEMSWYFEPTEVQTTYWSEAAIGKMREPTGHGYPRLLPSSGLEKLMSLI